jgi:hypothetical protein
MFFLFTRVAKRFLFALSSAFRVHSHPHCFGPHRTALPLLHFSASPLYRFADGWTDGRRNRVPGLKSRRSGGLCVHPSATRKSEEAVQLCCPPGHREAVCFAKSSASRSGTNRLCVANDKVLRLDFVQAVRCPLRSGAENFVLREAGALNYVDADRQDFVQST